MVDYIFKAFSRVFFISGVFVGSLFFAGQVQAVTDYKQAELKFLNWSEYIDPELIKKFEKEYNARVVEIYFESDSARDDMMVSTDASGLDLAVVNGMAIRTYNRAGWLDVVTEAQVPNLKHIIPRMKTAFPDAESYGVPYFFGNVGIAYRSDLVKKIPDSWMDMFKPEAYLHNKIGMSSDMRDMFGAALKALGYSVNSADPAENKAAARLLKEQKPFVKTYNYLTLDEDSVLVKGDIIMAMFYSGDAMMVAEHHESIDYLIPREGGNLWIDYLVVLKKSVNKQLAYDFINFLNEPENAAQLAESVYYATPNQAAEKLLSKELLEDSVAYPDKVIVNKSEFDGIIPPRIQKKRDAVKSELLQ